MSNAVANIGLSFIDCGGSQELHTRWQSLPVCVAGRDGLVREVNFGERILAKLYQFEAQDAREWVEKFGEREKLRFADKTTQRRTSVWDYASGKSYPIRLKQECYQHLNRKNGFTITYYGVVEIDAIRGGLMVERIAKDILHSVPEGTLRIAKNAEE